MSDVVIRAPARPASSSQAPSSVPGTIADPPRAVSQLASGTLLRGEVIARTDQGQSVVRTDLGDLTVTSKAQLAVGSQVTLQIRSSGAQLHIAVMQVDGHAPLLRGSQPTAVAGTPASPAAVAATTDGLPGTVAQPPLALGRLPNGAVVQGVVLGKDQAGHILVRTDFGTLPLATDVQLASGNRITLQINSLTPQIQVSILQGEVTQAAAVRPQAVPVVPPATATGSHLPATVDILTVGQSVQAVVQAPSSGGLPSLPKAASGQAAVPLQAGSSLQLRVLQVAVPATGTVPAPGAAPAPSGAPAPSPAVTTAGLDSSNNANALPRGGVPLAPAAGAQAASGQISLPATVIGTTAAGEPQISSPLGLLTLAIKAQLPPGTSLVLELPAAALMPAASTPPPAAIDPAALAYAWPALGLALDALQGDLQSLLAPQAPAASLPQPGPRLTSGLLFFLAALGGGTPGAWLEQLGAGDLQRRLERAGQGDLVTRLGRDLAQIGRLSDAAGNDWRLVPFPLYDGSELHQLRLFLRHGSGGRRDQGGGDGEDATRFVLEVSLTRIGDLQLDGLVRQKRFDLMLRTRQSLAEPLRRDIANIFHSANEVTGYTGKIAFQASADWSPMPIAASATTSHGLVV